MEARSFTAACLFIVVARVVSSPGQDGTPVRTDPYSICISKIQTASLEAYKPCALYLEQSYSDDADRIDYVKRWVTKFENALPQIEFLRSLAADERAAWVVYEPDMMIDLPQTSDDKDRYKIYIVRSFAQGEETMLRRAEAVYPGPGEMIQDVVRSFDAQVDETAKEMAPIWGSPGNDNIELTKRLPRERFATITTSVL